MDALQKSLALIDKHLAETPVAERSLDWQEIAGMGYGGPSIDQYLSSLDSELRAYNDSFESAVVFENETCLGIDCECEWDVTDPNDYAQAA